MNNTATIQPKERVVWLDFMRFIAMFAVICCHSTDPFNYVQGGENLAQIKFWGQIYGAFVRPCVPLFVMISGALLLPVREESSVFYRKRIPRVLWPFLIWSTIYCLFPWLTGVLGFGTEAITLFFPFTADVLSDQSFGTAVKYIAGIPLNFSQVGIHMWYIYLLIGLYLYMPVFSAWVEKASSRAKHWFLVAWAVTTILPYYFNFVSPYIWGGCSWNAFYGLYYFAGFNGYLLLGHYLRNIDWSWTKTLCLGIPLFLAGYAITFFGFRHMNALPSPTDDQLELFITFSSINVVMMTIPVFMFAKKVNIRSAAVRKALANLTLCGFGIYLVHYFFTSPSVEIARMLRVPLCLQIPAAAMIAFGISWLLVLVLRKLCGRKARIFLG